MCNTERGLGVREGLYSVRHEPADLCSIIGRAGSSGTAIGAREY